MNDKWYLNRQNWLPTPGNVLFVLLVAGVLFFVLRQDPTLSAGGTGSTFLASTNTISYQGQLNNPSGQPVSNGNYAFTFRLYSAAAGGIALWMEQWSGVNAVAVTDGLFHVMLGNITPIPQSVFINNSTLWLGVQVTPDSEMTSRIQLGSVPFATQALTVIDGAITTNKIANEAVDRTKLSANIFPAQQVDASSYLTVTGTIDLYDKAVITTTTDGGPLLIMATFKHLHTGPNGAMRVRIVVDGLAREQTGELYNREWGSGALLWLEEGLPAGTHVVKIQFGTTVSNEMAHIQHANLVVMELK